MTNCFEKAGDRSATGRGRIRPCASEHSDWRSRLPMIMKEVSLNLVQPTHQKVKTHARMHDYLVRSYQPLFCPALSAGGFHCNLRSFRRER